MSAEPPFDRLAATLEEHLGRVSRELDDMRADIACIGREAEGERAQHVTELTPVPEPAPVAASPEEPAPIERRTCPSCTAPVFPGASFCTACGAILTSLPPQPEAAPAPVEAPVAAMVAASEGQSPAAPAPAVPVGPPPPVRPSRLELAYRRWRGDLGLLEFFGRRVLVWIAGVVIVIGMVLLYRRAVQAGWIGPAARTLLGTALSGGLLAAAALIRSRLRSDEGALAAAGAGIAGLYASLYAAVSMYDLVGSAPGLALAFAIGALAVAIALRWSSPPLAILGLAGAGLAPVLVSRAVDPASMAFVTVVAAAGAVLWVRRGWTVVLAATTVVSLPQALVLLDHAHGRTAAFGWTYLWQTVIVSGAYWAVYEGSLAAFRRGRVASLDPLSALLATGAVAFALLSAAVIFTGDPRGYALLAVGAVYLCVTAFFAVVEPGQRDLTTLSWVTALTAVTAGIMILLGGATRVVAIALEGGLHVYLAGRLREPRLQLSAAAHLVLAAGFALALAPPSMLVSYPPDAMVRGGSVASDLVRAGIFSVLAVAIGCVAFARWHLPAYVWSRSEVALATFWTAVVVCLYAVSVSVVGGFLWATDTQRSFQNAHTVVSVVWAAVAFGLVFTGFRRQAAHIRLGGLALFVAALAKLFVYDLARLESTARAVSFIAVGLILLVSGIVYRELSLRAAGRDRRGPPFGTPPAGTAIGG
jgi:uncharacterized membrane protein